MSGLLTERILESTATLLRVSLPEVNGYYELTCLPLLAQCGGECRGIDFLFHSKYGRWTFETEDSQGHPFRRTDSRSFYREGHYDDRTAAVLNIEWAAALVRKCLFQLAEEQAFSDGG